MTVSATTNKVQANGNGAATAFSYPYYFLDNSHLVVTTTDVATNVETIKVITTDYTVTGALSASGGTVTFVTAPSTGTRVTIKNVVPLTQETDYTESSAFPSEANERALDKLTMAVQQVQEKINRSVQLTETSTASGPIYVGNPVADNVIGWNTAGTALENKGAFTNAASLAYIDVSNASPSTSPSATSTDSLAIGNAAIASGTRAVAIGNARATGQDSFAMQNNDNTSVGATATNAVAIGAGAFVSSVRGTNIGGNFNEVTTGTDNAAIGGTTNTVEGGDAVNIGGNSNLVDGSKAVNLGGLSNKATGDSCVVLGGSGLINASTRGVLAGGSGNSSTTGTDTAIVGGTNNITSGNQAVVIGGTSGTASQTGAVVISGSNCVSSGTRSVTIGGVSNTASGTDSLATGQGCGATGTGSSAFGLNAQASLQGEMAQSTGRFATNGDAQARTVLMRNVTSNATPTLLYIDGASATLRPTIPTDTTWFFKVFLAARRTDVDGESAAYEFTGCCDNNAGTSLQVGSITKTVIAEDTAAWDADVSIGDAADVLNITVTGEASKTIRWVAKVEIVQVSG